MESFLVLILSTEQNEGSGNLFGQWHECFHLTTRRANKGVYLSSATVVVQGTTEMV